MSPLWWTCDVCGQELYDSRAVYDHRRMTGHERAQITTPEVPPAPGSTPEHRAAALKFIREQIAAARRRHQEPAK